MPCFNFNYLIKNGFIKELVKFAIKKLPNSFQSLTPITIAYSIAQNLNRCFCYLYYISTKTSLVQNSKYVVNNLVNELFVLSNLPQVKCLIENISDIFYKKSSFKNTNASNVTSSPQCFFFSGM